MFGLRKLWSKIKGTKIAQGIEKVVLEIFTREGFKQFFEKYKDTAIDELKKLREIHGTADLKVWEQQAFDNIKAMATKDAVDIKDNWVQILINVVYENLKIE
jgi:mRNA-degrading endonuclease HigB of HigAB toxin-antitoxin module